MMNEIVANFNEFVTELRNRGVNILSGEGCQMGTRLDTDVSPEALPIVQSFYGGVKLIHSGYNGWCQDPQGKWHAGRSQAWDYENTTVKEGWTTHDGNAFKLHRTLIPELLIYLILHQDDPYAIIHVERKRDPEQHLTISERLYVFENGEEYGAFMDLDDDFDPMGSDDFVLDAAYYFKKQIDLFDIRYQMFFGNHKGSNMHMWSGKNIT